MSEEKKVKWKNTLNLPKTNFPMKAQLNRREPEILEKWENMDIYRSILEKRKNDPIYILHDGPPYANGKIHLGHALNKILKDFIVKTKSMEGFQAPYVPGWDCHGLPIELKVDQELGSSKKNMSVLDIRHRCRNYAEKFLKIQKKGFKRLGIFGDWQNPYKTIDPTYESSIIKYFKSFVKNNSVIRKKRPVFWCNSCQTALAEAEVVYSNHISSSIYVKFLLKEIPDFLEKYKNKEIFVVIWTTTPWTIPANLAIALHPDYDYSLFEMKGEYHICATRLIPVLADILKTDYKKIIEFKGSKLNGLNAIHPLYNRNSLIINANYVELDSGTGCVHTAPGHGEDDYRAGLEYNLDIYSPVDSKGHFDNTTGKYEGKEIFKANSEIIQDLKDNNRLMYETQIEHSYPHCWRCKKPVIFRATEQWFISIDTADLRKKALNEIKKVKWYPAWGEERISNMVENRPDWCISRQRDWGVPIPVFFCKNCREPILSIEAIEKTEKIFNDFGSDSWYKKDISEFLPEDTTCKKCGGKNFEKGNDILDVWFESGSSFGILEKRPGHKFPADMYLEGGDQYRGWFHSSLLVGVTTKDQSPYKEVITHGWALDEHGKAMSKSLGNIIEPQSIIEEQGAEILRLWVAMVNYKEDVRLGKEILSRVIESYRKIRNTWRFMLGNISDFNPGKDSVSDEQLREIDLFILYKLQKLKQRIFKAYTDYEYHIIYHTISNFFTIDLSSFYLHVVKDNLYCNSTNSKKRRSTQTVIFKLLKETILLIAPILSFTTEEVWGNMPDFKGKENSVHLNLFPKIEKKYLNIIDNDKWEKIIKLRDNILKEIENARDAKIIGDSLEAEIDLDLNDEYYNIVSANIKIFKEILVVSKINLKKSEKEKISIQKSNGKKCPRCWNWFSDDTSKNKLPELCPRCSLEIEELNFDPE